MRLRYCDVRLVILVLMTLVYSGVGSAIAESFPPHPSVPAGKLGRDVNPFIGTGGISYLCGNNFPGATVRWEWCDSVPIRFPSWASGRLIRRAITSRIHESWGSVIRDWQGPEPPTVGIFCVIPCDAETAQSHRRGLNSEYLPSG